MIKPIDSTPKAAAADPSADTGLQKKKLKNACEEFESFLAGYLLKSMRDTVMKDEEEGDPAESTYQNLLDQTLSKDLSHKQGLGLAKALYDKLSPLVKEDPLGKAGQKAAQAAPSAAQTAPAAEAKATPPAQVARAEEPRPQEKPSGKS